MTWQLIVSEKENHVFLKYKKPVLKFVSGFFSTKSKFSQYLSTNSITFLAWIGFPLNEIQILPRRIKSKHKEKGTNGNYLCISMGEPDKLELDRKIYETANGEVFSVSFSYVDDLKSFLTTD